MSISTRSVSAISLTRLSDWKLARRRPVDFLRLGPVRYHQSAMEKDGSRPRTVADSQSEMAEVVLPNDANPLGNLLGGRLMHWIDLAGAMAAHRHSRSYVVTASMDHLDFLAPVHVGDLIILKSSVNRAFHTSMEVGVKVFVESYLNGTHRHVSSAYLTFVAVDQAGRHLTVPPVVPETEEEKERFEDAGRRRELRRIEMERKRASKRT